MARGDIQWSGRAVRWLFWRAPKGAAKYAWDSNMALASDLGRRWIVLGVYGGFLWVARQVAEVVTPLRTPVAVLILLWFFWAVSLARWSWNARPGAARNRQALREIYQSVHEVRGDVRGFAQQVARGLPGRGGEGVDVLNLFRTQPDPVTAEQQRTRREQAEQVRGWLPEESRGIPLGDRPEPLVRMPRWMRRRGPR